MDTPKVDASENPEMFMTRQSRVIRNSCERLVANLAIYLFWELVRDVSRLKGEGACDCRSHETEGG